MRAQATVAYAAAVALGTSGYDATAVGLSAASAKARATRLAVGLAMAHKANAGAGGWGHCWECAYWVFLSGSAGWYLFEDMTGPEQQSIARMVADEADFQMSQPVVYYADRNGQVLTPGNSRAEEDAWNSTILGLGQVARE